MPNPILKYLTMFQGIEGYGFTEVHYQQAGTLNPDLGALIDVWRDTVVPARAALLGEDYSIVGYRVSYPRKGAIAATSRRKKFTGWAQVGGASPSVSLAINFENANFTASKVLHMRGFPDEVEFEESYRPDRLDGWEDRLVTWINALKAQQMGWLSVDPTVSTSGDVLGYAVQTDNTIVFTLKAPGINEAFVGTRQQIRFSRFGNGRSILNRSLLVEVTDATHVRTVKPVGANPMTSTGHYNHRATSFLKYASTASISIGERRAGKVLNRYPGRSAVKPLF